MYISSVKNLGPNRLDSTYLSTKRNLLSFKGHDDSFTSAPEIVKGSIKQSELSDILKTTKEKTAIKSGFTSNIFTFEDRVIKVPSLKTVFDKKHEQHLKGQNLKEFYALSKIQEIDSDIVAKPYGVIRDKDSYYLVEELIQGVHPKGNSLKKEHLTDLLGKFFKLDSNGITNCDLQSGNIFLTSDNKTKLIDFGSFNFITNKGIVASSDHIYPQMFNSQVYEDTSLDASVRFLKALVANNFKDTKNLMDNPYLTLPSNMVNFEFRTLYSHLLDNSEENPLEFFRQYLKLKAQNYHAELKDFLSSLSFDEINISDFENDKIENAKTGLKSAIDYEELMKETLSNPTDDVIKVELSKLQLRAFLNTSDSLNSPIENPKKLQAAYNQLVSILEEAIENSDGTKKQYFIETLNGLKSRLKNYIFVQEQVEIPESENLIKMLFKKPILTEKGIKEAEKSVSNLNKKLGAFFVFGAVAIFFIIKLMKQKGKKVATVQNNQTTSFNMANMLKNAPDAFANFKK